MTNTVYEFKDKRIKEYLGDIDYFLEQRNLQNLREAEKRTTVVSEEKKTCSNGKQDYEQQKKLKSLRNKLSNTEASIHKLEKEIKETAITLHDRVIHIGCGSFPYTALIIYTNTKKAGLQL